MLTVAIERCGYVGKVKFGIDPASSEFFRADAYDLGLKSQRANKISPEQLAGIYRELIDKYPVVLLEDPFAQDDWNAWTAFNRDCKVELVGDDLLATNIDRITEAHQKGACNALLLKINQIGTISEAIAA